MRRRERKIKAVLFDLDDTLIDRAGGFVRMCRHWYQTLAPDGRPDDGPVADVCGARRLGMCTAWIHHGRNWEIAEPPPDYVIAGAWEVGGLLGVAP